MEVIRRFEFDNIGEARNTIKRHIDFYNNERLQSTIGYIISDEYKMHGSETKKLKSNKRILFIFKGSNHKLYVL